MTKDDAEKLSLLYLKIGADLDQSVSFIQDRDQIGESDSYAHSTGRAMATLYSELMEPLWKKFPDLLPDYLGGSYTVSDDAYEPRFYHPES